MINKVNFTPPGERDFSKLNPQVQKRIQAKIQLYMRSGKPLHFAKPLVNIPPSTHRFRVGKYRICFYIQETSIVIDSIDTRGDAYRR